MDVRRVVTGHDADGKAVFVADERVAPAAPALLPGTEFHRLWGGDEAPSFPDDGTCPPHSTYFPPVGGFRFGLVTIPPGGAAAPAGLDRDAAIAEMDRDLPELRDYMERGNPGMHTTATIDFEVVLEGEVTLELDDGVKMSLQQGDTVVQNGTRHRWSNFGDVPARLAVFICGAHHERAPGG